MRKLLTEKDVYNFTAHLKHVDDDECFDVAFRVLAEDVYQAKTILKEWLETPEQTGYRYDCCVGITAEPSNRVIVAEEVEE